MIVSAFSRKDSYDRRVSQKNYAQSLYPSIKVFCLAMLRRWFVIINGRVALSHKKCTILVVFFFYEERTGLRKVEDNFFLCSSMAVSASLNIQYYWYQHFVVLIVLCFCVFFFLQNHEFTNNKNQVQSQWTSCQRLLEPVLFFFSSFLSSSSSSTLTSAQPQVFLPQVAHFSASCPSEHIIIQSQATVVLNRAVTEELTRESLLKEVQYRPHRPAPLLALMQTCPRPISNLCQVSTILRRWRHMEQTQGSPMNMN